MDKTTSSREETGSPMGLKILQSGFQSILRQHLGRAILSPHLMNYEHMPIIWQTKKPHNRAVWRERGVITGSGLGPFAGKLVYFFSIRAYLYL
jgi:hypothetical protein